MITKLILAVLAFCVAVFMLFEKIIRKEKNTSLFEYVVFFMLLASAGITGYQIWADNDIENNSVVENNLKNENLRKAIQHGIDSGISVNNRLLADAFKRQNIDLDSLKRTLIEMKNDTPKISLNMPEVTPDITFNPIDGIKFINRNGGIYEFSISIVCRETQAKSVDIELFTVINNSKSQYVKLDGKYVIGNNLTDFSKDEILDTPLKISVSNDDSIRVLFVVAKGKYWNALQTKSYPLYAVRLFDMSQLRFSVLMPQSYPNVISYLEPR